MSEPYDRYAKIRRDIIPRARRYLKEQNGAAIKFAATSACDTHSFSPTEQELNEIIEAIRT